MKRKDLNYKKSKYVELLKLGLELDRQLNCHLNIGDMVGYYNIFSVS